jgi:hypothetical protein
MTKMMQPKQVVGPVEVAEQEKMDGDLCPWGRDKCHEVQRKVLEYFK